MSEQVITVGLQTIGCIRAHGRGFKVWSEPERESLGVFPTNETAARAIYDHDVKARLQKAVEVDTE